MKLSTALIFSSLILILLAGCKSHNPIYISTIPLECERVESILKSMDTPKGFEISIYDAHKLAMNTGGVIKPCLSKLEQAIYRDKKYYYFTNSILIHKNIAFPEKYIRVDGKTGECISTF